MQLIILPNLSNDAPTNMAIDASLLHTLPEDGAVFRHYGWTEPAATFGYSQHIDQVHNVFAEKIQLCRRMTGGGIVDHRNDWTYTLAFNSRLQAAQIEAIELYAKVHCCTQTALAEQSVTTQLAPCPRACEETPKITSQTPTPDQCFVLPAANDVIHPDGKKIAGAAMKRTRQGLLFQGSIDRSALPFDFNFQRFFNDFQESLSKAFDLELSENCTGLLDEDHIQKERQRFESESWRSRR